MILAKQMIGNLKHLHTSSAPVGSQETDYFSYKPPCNRATTDLGLAKNNTTEFTITNASDLEYFGEGSSNVLFRYIGENYEDELGQRPRLLRFRKQKSSSRTTKQIHDDIKKTFVPLLSSYVVQTDLCSIAPSVIKSLNETLRSKSIHNDDQGDEGDEGYDEGDGDRDDGDLLDEEEKYALVVEDMSPGIYQKHNEIAHGRSIRRSRQFPFLSPKASNASLISGENSEVNSGYNTDDDEIAYSADEQEDQGYDQKERSRRKNKLPIPKKKDLDPARLSARNWRDLLTVRFRPGCLAQPKSAPAGWSICRDCASRHMGSSCATTPPGSADSGLSDCSEDSGNASSSSPPYCPLDLISPDPSRVHAAIESVISAHRSVKILDEEEVLVNDPALGISGITPWLDVLEYSIVNILADYFWDQGSIGHVLERLQEGDRKTDAEALRNCTLYVRLWMRNKDQDDNYEVHIECKVGGLDNLDGKEGEELEQQLVRGGWYLGRGFHGAICRRE